jgi:large subunit ribosomal protein L15
MESKYQLKRPDSLKRRKRAGRGMGSGIGKTCGRGQDGQLSRSGSKKRPWFEGGQMPIQRRIPKRGFNNSFKRIYQIVNLSQLSGIDAGDINQKLMKEMGLIKKLGDPVKILGVGDLSKALHIQADAFSNSAKEKIEKAGGKASIKKYSEEKGESKKEA